MSESIYDVIQDKDRTITTDVACLYFCIKTMMEVGKITKEQQNEFLKEMKLGCSYREIFDKLNSL